MVKRPIHRLNSDHASPEMDELAEEVIITISCADEVVVRLLATPFDLEDLAYGHIFCEGRGSIDSIKVEDTEIFLTGEIKRRPNEDLLTAACGACTTGEIEVPLGTVSNTQKLRANIGKMIGSMRSSQPMFESTGGVHAASIFDNNGKLLITREDIGRHNAFDKAIGSALRKNIPAKIIALSGRVGWELVAKAVRSGVEIILSVGAISSAAESLARSSGITVVGFASRERPAVVGDLSRIIDKPSSSRED